MISCDRDCYNCPYPDVPEECLAEPIQPWESEIMQWSHHKVSNNTRDHDHARYKHKLIERKCYAEKRWAKEQECIALIRKQHGMMQKELAAAAGVTQVTICSWEKGIYRANWDKLCAVLPELKAYRPKGGNNGDRI